MDVRIIGLGNVLMGDEGIGPYVVRMLRAQYDFPPDVTLMDAGTPWFELLPALVDADVVIAVDAIDSGEAPGSIRLQDAHALLKRARMSAGGCQPDQALGEALLSLERSVRSPKQVLLIGVVPQWIATGPHLSEPLRRGVPRVMERVVYELERVGLHACRRAECFTPDIWWEEGALSA